MRHYVAILVALSVLCCAPARSATRNTGTQKLVSEYSRKEPLRSGVFGMLAVRGSDTLAQYNRRVKMVPASNVKLITTGLALRQLGPDWRFSTSLAYSGKITDGVLEGDLYILGGGDPTTGSGSPCADLLPKTFGSWMTLLTEAGIKEIRGNIVGDARFFKRPSQGLSWQAEDLGYNYGAGPSGLNFFENAQRFCVTPSVEGKSPSVRPLYPDTPWMSYMNMAVTGPARSGNSIYYLNNEYAPVGEFQGSFPSDRKSYTLEGSNSFGAYTCAYYFYNYLCDNGIAVHGRYADVSPLGLVRTDLLFSDIGPAAAHAESLTPIGKKQSPTVAQIVRDTNYESDNFYAESLFNMLAVSLYGHADRELSERAVYQLLKDMGLRTDGACQLLDGSGLSRKDYVSPDFFVSFLRKMYLSPEREPYVESLPSPGSKSTLQNRLPKAPDDVKERIKMKSGSMNGVRSFSGYILPASGNDSKPIVFSIITNNVSGPTYKVAAIIDEIILSLAQEP
ncbi:MAG: D-alanyl-D-alanine carboxypeptidase [Bacteroidales bacterium]|nr:D-alanyl-D-alanine carboxypeptidase [Bacteroidales bacterium]